MDALTIGLLFTGIAGGLALWWKNRSPGEQFDFIEEKAETPKTDWQQLLEKDPQTRLLERPKRQYRLLNDIEQELYMRLLEAMPNMRVFAQIGVAQLAQLRGRIDSRRLLKMAGRGVDFIICNSNFDIIAAIELAWPAATGETPSESEKQAALASLGIPLIIFRPNQLPNAEVISREIANAIVRRNRLEKARH